MSWVKTGKPVTKLVNKELATKFANMEGAPGDRPLSERRLLAYRKMLEDGRFRPVNWATAYCGETDKTYRVNGKHTSTMICRWEGPLPEFYAVLEDYSCDGLKDVADLYSTFDSKSTTRSVQDIYLAFARTVDDLVTVPNEVVTAAIRGMSYAEHGQERSLGVPPQERAEMVMDYTDFVLWYNHLLANGDKVVGDRSRKKSPHIRNQAVAAVVFSSWKKNKADAERFWILVRDGSGLKPKSPDRVLQQYLILTPITSANRYEVYCKCAYAWNSFRRGDERLGNLTFRPDSPPPRIM